MVNCWVSHPYGTLTGDGVGKTTRMVNDLKAKGVSSPRICFTEDGISTDNGRCLNGNYGWPTCMTYDQAGTAIKDKVSGLRNQSWGSTIDMYLLYKGNDNTSSGATTEREDYFGYKNVSGGNKGGFTTAVIDLARTYPPKR
jgi:hypothetical protein